MSVAATTHRVSPSRLAPGIWCDAANRQHGEGDIHAAYSGDLIGPHGRIRSPFRFHGGLWTTVRMEGRGDELTTLAYRLVATEQFDDQPTSYSEQIALDGGEAARSSPLGFYQGMTVRHGTRHLILAGPPIRFIAGDPEPQQTSLF